MRNPAGERKLLKKRTVHAVFLDRAAVRAVTSATMFEEIEHVRSRCPRGREVDTLFWCAARTIMIEQAQKLAIPAVKIMPAKVAAVCTMLGLRSVEVDRIVDSIEVGKLVDAALANNCIQEFQRDPDYKHLWTTEVVGNNPPVRVNFEHAVVLGTISEAGDIAKSKSWGKLTNIDPLQEDDLVYPRNITYILKNTSVLRMRWEFRDSFKAVLGKDRRLVNCAMRQTKRFFLESLQPTDRATVRHRLGLSPAEFWQAVRYGERFGPGGIDLFIRRLEEKTFGYRLDFGEPPTDLVQIQPARTPS
jgi:hypothetical protein